MVTRLLKKYQSYRDKKFLSRLERVLNDNVLKSKALILGDVFFGKHVVFEVPKAAMEDIASGIPSNLVLERIRQGYYEKQDFSQ